MTQLQKKFTSDKFIVIAVNDWRESRERVAEFAKRAKLDHLILIGGAAVSGKEYGVTSSPTAFWIDHRGTIVRRENGFNPDLMWEKEKRAARMLALRELDVASK